MVLLESRIMVNSVKHQQSKEAQPKGMLVQFLIKIDPNAAVDSKLTFLNEQWTVSMLEVITIKFNRIQSVSTFYYKAAWVIEFIEFNSFILKVGID